MSAEEAFYCAFALDILTVCAVVPGSAVAPARGAGDDEDDDYQGEEYLDEEEGLSDVEPPEEMNRDDNGEEGNGRQSNADAVDEVGSIEEEEMPPAADPAQSAVLLRTSPLLCVL
jgi:hypothetical protein